VVKQLHRGAVAVFKQRNRKVAAVFKLQASEQESGGGGQASERLNRGAVAVVKHTQCQLERTVSSPRSRHSRYGA
jgi:hypothetical protein